MNNIDLRGVYVPHIKTTGWDKSVGELTKQAFDRSPAYIETLDLREIQTPTYNQAFNYCTLTTSKIQNYIQERLGATDFDFVFMHGTLYYDHKLLRLFPHTPLFTGFVHDISIFPTSFVSSFQEPADIYFEIGIWLNTLSFLPSDYLKRFILKNISPYIPISQIARINRNFKPVGLPVEINPDEPKKRTTKTILFNHAIQARKQPLLFVKLAKHFQKTHPDYTFAMCYPNANFSLLNKIKSQTKTMSNFKILGKLDNHTKPTYLETLNSSFAVISHSIYDGFSISSIEALLRKIPVLLPTGTCFESVLKDVRADLLYESFPELVKKLTYYMENPNQKNKMVEKAAQFIKQEYSPDKVISRILSHIEARIAIQSQQTPPSKKTYLIAKIIEKYPKITKPELLKKAKLGKDYWHGPTHYRQRLHTQMGIKDDLTKTNTTYYKGER